MVSKKLFLWLFLVFECTIIIYKTFQDRIFSAWLNTHFIYEEGKKLSNGCSITPDDVDNRNNTNNTKNSITTRDRSVKSNFFNTKLIAGLFHLLTIFYASLFLISNVTQ